MPERYIKIENNLILDTQAGRVIRNPIIVVDPDSYLIVDITDEYVLQYIEKLIDEVHIRTPKYRYISFKMTDEDADMILNNLNAYDYFMKSQDFDSVKLYIKQALRD